MPAWIDTSTNCTSWHQTSNTQKNRTIPVQSFIHTPCANKWRGWQVSLFQHDLEIVLIRRIYLNQTLLKSERIMQNLNYK